MASATRKVVVTGASGFVGSALLRRLAEEPLTSVRACYRAQPATPASAETKIVGEVSASTDWSDALAGVEVVVHTAARAHAYRIPDENELRRTNVEGTIALARQAAAAGVKRLIFLSSIKVNGEATPADRPFEPGDSPAPSDAYGRSKRDGEVALAEIAAETGLEVVVLRPPLVFGPGAKGNLARLMRLIERGIPLPLGGIRNQRSMIALSNLCDAIASCLDAAEAAGKTYLLAERHDLSTPELVKRIARAMERRPLLVPVPGSLLRAAGALLGRRGEVDRLVESLRIDGTLISRDTGWTPSERKAGDDIDAMARAFLSEGLKQG